MRSVQPARPRLRRCIALAAVLFPLLTIGRTLGGQAAHQILIIQAPSASTSCPCPLPLRLCLCLASLSLLS